MSRRHGMTLIEVLVALAVFAIFAASAVGLLSTGLRAGAAAGRAAEATAALEPHTVPARIEAAPPPACAPGTAGSACTAERTRCRLTAASVVCDGSGSLWRTVVRFAPPSGAVGARRPTEIRVWSRVTP